MRKVTKQLLVATFAAMVVSACQDSVNIVQPEPQPLPPGTPGTLPSIQIQQITNAAGTVINPAAAAGQLNFVLNVEPGDGNSLTAIRVLLDGVMIAGQTFSGSRGPAQDNGISVSFNVAAGTEIIVPFDTREPNDSGDRYTNTEHTVTAEMTHSGGSASAAALKLTFMNLNVSKGISFDGNNAKSSGGATWFGNDDVVATCSGIWYDPIPSTLSLTPSSGLDIGKGSNTVLKASTSAAGDLVASASGTYDMTDSDNKVELASSLACAYPATSAGYDTDGDGVVDQTGAFVINKAFNIDNVAPGAPGTGNYTFKDARNSAAQATAPVNTWGNGTTAFGVTGLDGGIGTLVATINEAIPVGSTFGNPASIDVGPEVSTGADLGESASSAASGSFKLLLSALADGLGNATKSTTILPNSACNTCSAAFWIDLTLPAYSKIRPNGIAVLRPDDGTFGKTAVDVITDFTVVERLSGLDTDGAGVSGTGQTQSITVKRSGTTIGSALAPPQADGTVTGSGGVSQAVSSAGVSTVVQTNNAYTVAVRLVDQAGNVADMPGTAFTVDITSPILNVTTPPVDFNLPGATTAPASLAGDFTDANGIAKANVTGFLGTCAIPVSQFTIADADADVIDLGIGPTFSAAYVLKTKGTGTGTTLYSYPVTIWDTSLFMDQKTAGNATSTCANQNGIW